MKNRDHFEKEFTLFPCLCDVIFRRRLNSPTEVKVHISSIHMKITNLSFKDDWFYWFSSPQFSATFLCDFFSLKLLNWHFLTHFGSFSAICIRMDGMWTLTSVGLFKRPRKITSKWRRNNMSSTVKWALLFSYVKSVLKTVKI